MHRLWLIGLPTLVVLTFAAATARPHAVGSARAATEAANLWVDRSGGSCTRATKPDAYRDGAACASIDAAWDACRPGDLIVVKSGAYGPQSITGDKPSPGCTVRGEEGVTIGDLSTGGRFFRLERVTVDVGSERRAGWADRASDVTLENVRLHGPFVGVDISGVSNVRWVGGELGTAGQMGGARVCGVDAEPFQVADADHVTVNGVRFHPQAADPTPNNCSANGFHLEMMRLDGGTTFFTLRNSTFDSGDQSGTASVFITEPGGYEDPHDLTFENNLFGTNDSVGAFDVHANVQTCRNFTFAYNTFLASPGAFQCEATVNTRWIGNLGTNAAASSCAGTFIANVWQDSRTDNCGSDRWVLGTRNQTDKLGLGGADGFQLLAGSPAIDAAEASGYCTGALGSRDHDGRPRQLGIRCDAGALEYAAKSQPAVVSSLTTASWSRGDRTLRLRFSHGESVSVAARLVRGRQTLARAHLSAGATAVGHGVLVLVVPRTVTAGAGELRVVFTDAANNARAVRQTLAVPPPPR